jgi:hypothetical protein
VAIPLKDFRVPIPENVHLWLEAEATAFGVDMQVIARNIMKEWAKKKAHAYKVATKRMQANGLQMDLVGDDEEDDGASAKSLNQRGTK